MTFRDRALRRPQSLWVRKGLFQIHLWVGAVFAAYILLMSISGSAIVYRNQLSGRFAIEWLVKLHENLLLGSTGRAVNGMVAVEPLVVVVPGVKLAWCTPRSLNAVWFTAVKSAGAWDTSCAIAGQSCLAQALK